MKYLTVNGEQHEIDLDQMELEVHFDTEGWSDFAGQTPEQQIISATKNENDLINMDFDLALNEIGYELNTEVNHHFSRVGNNQYTVTYYIKHL